MKILLINKYLRPKGGAETYVLQLGKQLEAMGHQVQYFGMAHPENTVGNRAGAYSSWVDFHDLSLWGKMRWGPRVLYSAEARKKLRAVLEDFQPDVCHLNNFHYQLTPSILLEIAAWRRERRRFCRILCTAHDYQLVCPNHMCYDGTQICEDCLGGKYGSCVRKKCIHGSRLRSILGALESTFWHRSGIYREIDSIVCCSEFLKKKLDMDPDLAGKTLAMRNFTQPREISPGFGEYVLYFGRFSREKGVALLMQAAKALPHIPFVFAGDGVLAKEMTGLPNVRNVGFQSGAVLETWIRNARFTVTPSVWYENCPFSVLESLSLGVPVLGADIGGIPELITPGITGRLFPPGDLPALVNALEQMWKDPGPRAKYDGITLKDYAVHLENLYCLGDVITIVVPVYNVAGYLDRCVESLVSQSYKDLEILLIDDGSTDESPSLCDAWAAKDRRVRVLHQENAGLGMARNAGIAAATGKAICFVDSDDYLHHRAIELAWEQMGREKTETVIFGMDWENAGKKKIYLKKRLYRGAEVAEELLPKLLQQQGNLPISSCAGLYSMELVRRTGWRFPSERQIIAEDVYALLELYGKAGSAAVLPDALYVYCHRENSLTRSYRPDRFEKLKAFYLACLEKCREYPEEVRRSCAAPFLGLTIGAMKQEAALGHREAVDAIISDPLVRQALEENPEKPGFGKRLLFWAMVNSPNLAWLLLRAKAKGGPR